MTSPYRLYGAILLLLLEMFFLSVLVDASSISRTSIIGKLLSNAGDVLRWSIVSAGLLTLYFTQTKNWTRNKIRDKRSSGRIIGALALHGVLFAAIVVVTFQFFQVNRAITLTQGLLWLSLILAAAATWCLVIVDGQRWIEFLLKEKRALIGISICSLVIVVAGKFFQQFWEVLNAFTLSGTRFVLEIFYKDVFFNLAEKKLGVTEFWVFVDSACSGIEGIVVAASTTAIYLYLSRDQLRFPHSLALIPIACLFSIILNVLRIAALIAIGIEYSPKLAVEGFHSVAGWLTAVAVALIIIFIFSSWKWILRNTADSNVHRHYHDDHNLAIAILAPFAVFIGLTLFGRIFSTEFDYFYPLKITLTAVTLAYYWKKYELRLPHNTFQIIAAAIATALCWMILVDTQPELDRSIVESVTRMSGLSATVWVVWRAASFWIIVPVFEELLFRSYLLSRLAGQQIDNNRKPHFHWVALLVTSILFGLIHDAWIAGFVAGVIFAWLRFRSDSLTSCIIAHGLANFLITIWAIHSGHWSLI